MPNAATPQRPTNPQLPTRKTSKQRSKSFQRRRKRRVLSRWRAACMDMENRDWSKFSKPYDLRERLFEYACVIVYLVQFLHSKDVVARSLADQILRAGNSAGANYEEADDGSSSADTRGKRRISLRELKETLFRLRVLRATGYLGPEHDPVLQETLELKRIMASLVRKSPPKKPRP